MAFECDCVPEDWRSAVTVLLYKGERERTECQNYMLSVVAKIYAGILVDRVCRLTMGSIEDEQGVSDQGGGV